jgi:hypothetical protein
VVEPIVDDVVDDVVVSGREHTGRGTVELDAVVRHETMPDVLSVNATAPLATAKSKGLPNPPVSSGSTRSIQIPS